MLVKKGSRSIFYVPAQYKTRISICVTYHVTKGFLRLIKGEA